MVGRRFFQTVAWGTAQRVSGIASPQMAQRPCWRAQSARKSELDIVEIPGAMNHPHNLDFGVEDTIEDKERVRRQHPKPGANVVPCSSHLRKAFKEI